MMVGKAVQIQNDSISQSVANPAHLLQHGHALLGRRDAGELAKVLQAQGQTHKPCLTTFQGGEDSHQA